MNWRDPTFWCFHVFLLTVWHSFVDTDSKLMVQRLYTNATQARQISSLVNQFDAIYTAITLLESVRDKHPSNLMKHKDILACLTECIRVGKEKMLYEG